MLAVFAILAIEPVTVGLGLLTLAAVFGLTGCSDSDEEKAKAPESQKAESSGGSGYKGPVYGPVQGINCVGPNMSQSFPYLDTSLLRTVGRLNKISEQELSNFFSLYNIEGDPGLAHIDFSRVCPAVPIGEDYDPEDVVMYTIRSSDVRIDNSTQVFLRDRSDWKDGWSQTQQSLYNALEELDIQDMGKEPAITLGMAYGPVVFHVAKNAEKNEMLKRYFTDVKDNIRNNPEDPKSFLRTMRAFSAYDGGDGNRKKVREALFESNNPFIREFIPVFIDGGYALIKANELYKKLEQLAGKDKPLPAGKVDDFKEALRIVARTIGIPQSESDMHLSDIKIDFFGDEIRSNISLDNLTTRWQKEELIRARKKASELMDFAKKHLEGSDNEKPQAKQYGQGRQSPGYASKPATRSTSSHKGEGTLDPSKF